MLTFLTPPLSSVSQGLRPGVPPVSPPITFASPTKLVSEGGSQVEYMGANRVPDFQKVFQVTVMSSAEIKLSPAAHNNKESQKNMKVLKGRGKS